MTAHTSRNRQPAICASRPQPRRRLLTAGLVATTSGFVLPSCDLFSTDPSSGEPQHKTSGPKGSQAPQLADLVRAGKLPPVAQRLPSEPLVITPTSTAGAYGGEWHTIVPEVQATDAYNKVGYDNLVRWDPKWTKVIPNIAKSWETGKEGRDFTFHLRPGMKWSDGAEFTAADIVFAYNDVLRNSKLYPVFPEWLSPNGHPARVEAPDSHTVTVSFDRPNGFFLDNLSSPDGNLLTSLPKHYLKRFHPAYAKDANDLAKKAGFGDWTKFFFSKGGGGLQDLGAWQDTDLPTILAWQVTTPLTGSRLVLERNPYYWKTDPQGSQLPYLDRVVADVGLDPEVATLKMSHGTYSLPDTAGVTVADKPVLARNRKPGKYHFVDVVNADMNTATVIFNMMHKNPAMRQVFQNKDFRVGMSYAVNRKEIITSLLQRQGTPYQAAPRPESKFYDERFAHQFTEYDPEKAAAHLDRAGLDQRDDEGLRLGPDGRPFAFTFKFMLGWHPYFPDMAERIQKSWKDVGVDVRVKAEEQTKFGNDMPTNTHDCVLYGGDNGMLDALLRPSLLFPQSGGSYFAIPWGLWYETQGRQGARPPGPARKQMQLYDRIKATLDKKQRRDLFMQLLAISREQFYVLGISLPAGNFNVVQNDFHNVPDSMLDASVYPDPGPTMPEQYFRDERGS